MVFRNSDDSDELLAAGGTIHLFGGGSWCFVGGCADGLRGNESEPIIFLCGVGVERVETGRRE